MSVDFLEESAPILIASGFNLMDYDSPDALSTGLTVTLTLTQAIDRESEGIRAEVTGGVNMIEQNTTEDFTRVYILSNGSSYSQYEEVCTDSHDIANPGSPIVCVVVRSCGH